MFETLLFFFKQKYNLFLETYFFKVPKNFITSAFFFFFAEADTKKHRYLPTAEANFKRCTGKTY